jgi:hypothetical protein
MSEHLSARCTTERGSGRCNICVASSDNVSPFLLNANSGVGKNKIKGMPDMKKIKSKLVTIVTDNVRLVGIVGNKNLLARMLQEGSGKAASREETKKVAMRQE